MHCCWSGIRHERPFVLSQLKRVSSDCCFSGLEAHRAEFEPEPHLADPAKNGGGQDRVL
jgi:hypothetical protein